MEHAAQSNKTSTSLLPDFLYSSDSITLQILKFTLAGPAKVSAATPPE